MTRKRLLDGARIVVGLLVLVAIFAALQGNWDKVAPELARLSWVSLGGAFLLALVAPWLLGSWKPMVGWVSRPSSPGRTETDSLMPCSSSWRRRPVSAWQARSTSCAAGLSSNASKRCSTVMYSWRASRASW